MAGKELGLGRVASRTGLAVSAQHYYESIGLIGSNPTGANQRRYERRAIRRSSMIRFAQALGLECQTSGLRRRYLNRREPYR